ncbi:PBP2_Bug_TTT domain containing protein [uncultured Caudovirales phage]|uniref:PBP2_Bug_TTT domain containing protein n=1 Tax=uncultured Caudovirales phage TaxID=2100421 RepID=A0A6J5LV27_9CAUD|nr:PBP2_Bug_TTT domain containing protein [uncultured Caudovirales phage]
MNKIIAIIVAAGLTVSSAWANSSFEPTKRPIEIVVPYPPGGATDRLARIVDQIFQEHGWKSHVVNKPGADGVIGGNFAAKAKPDGHTVFMSGTGLLDANIAFRAPSIEYNERSFVPIVPVANVSYVLAVKKGMPIDSYEKFKFYVKANPNKFNVAFWNANTANVFYEWAKAEGLPRPNIILYKGSGPQIIDLLGGHVDFAWDTWIAAAPHFNADKINIIATLDNQGAEVVKKIKPGSEVVSVAQRHPELGIGVWYGLWAPAGTPKNVVDEMNRVINRALKDPKHQATLENLNVKRYGGTADSLGRLQGQNFNTLKKLAQ